MDSDAWVAVEIREGLQQGLGLDAVRLARLRAALLE